MKKFYFIFLLLITAGARAQILRPFTVRYNNASVKGNIIQVANNIYTTVGGVDRTTNPGNTTEAPPGGVSRNNGTLGKNINIDAMIPWGSSWKYLAGAASTPAGWTGTGFSDAAWPSANGELGYGDADETTCIAAGGTSGGTLCVPTGTKGVTAYFRKTINIPNPASYTGFRFKVERDDGYVLYVNGVERSRNNMPVGAVAHSTLASADVNDGFVTFTLAPAVFSAGNNVIAVEVHQRSTSSDDLSFDLEMNALTGTSDDIFSASSADLNLPSCSQVLFAGLYWGATQGTDGTNVTWISNETSVKVMVPGSSSYTNVTSSQTDYHNGTLVSGLPHTGYRCFADITSLFNSTSPNGTYKIANVVAPDSIVNGAGGWTIVIAYADPSTIIRNLTIFDGSAIMNGGDPALNVPITGFLTPPSGPVSCELGAVVYDGDRTSLDAYKFKQDANPLVGVYTDLTPNATSAASDMWNSTISAYGSNITTRNPAHRNTLGYDADIIIVPNTSNAVLGNNATSASIRFESPSENYFIHTVSTAISQYTPSFNLNKTSSDINGGTLVPGDVLRYQVDYQNGGNDASTATVISDNIPLGTSYKANSLVINGVAKTDAMGDDEAEYDFTNNRVVFRLGTGANGTTGGELASGASGYVRFDVYTPSSCQLSACYNTLRNRARISYNGKLSGISLYDSSGVLSGGCLLPDPRTDQLNGTCMPLGDTILANICPATTVLLPEARYGGYRFYTGMPFSSGTLYNPATPITTTRVIYAFYDGPGSCDDTIRINVYITACPDIDDDNDGIPDYVELNNPVALQDADSDGIPNWNDATYPGFIDLNSDGFNDNFDPSADSDNDNIPNFIDPSFPGWTDTNSDGVNDNMDKDLDGIPNHLDLDSDNDGIPDTVESFGVDANGDGRIDNYTDTDNDGLSQNVDGSNTGVANSGTALGALDTDGDGIGNYLDLDSDNDGIPDAAEVYGTDGNNDGKQDSYSDTDGDGLTDAADGDVGNDGTAENAGSALLRTGADVTSDGRADSWPYNNMDSDLRPNPYDLDSDGDGITDVKEAQFTDADWNGRIDGAVNANGWNTAIAALPSLPLPNTDGNGRANPYDIDSDNDGIPDNVEGRSTVGYLLPATTDSDNDGIVNTYDNFVGFGGDGTHPVDTDGDGTPDYLDSDTDNDGLVDIIEGNDFNLNGMPDDNVTLTGLDTDGDGLDNRFDANNSSNEGTSAYMGNGGSLTGDATPGSNTMVQRTAIANSMGCATERDWRCIFYILDCHAITFKATQFNQDVRLNWTVLCDQVVDYFIVERSTDRTNFSVVQQVPGRPTVNSEESYAATDDISGISAEMLFYRLISKSPGGKTWISNIIAVKNRQSKVTSLQILPNPVKGQLQLFVNMAAPSTATIAVIDASGKEHMRVTENLLPGNNTLVYPQVSKLASGVYYLRLDNGESVLTERFSLIK